MNNLDLGLSPSNKVLNLILLFIKARWNQDFLLKSEGFSQNS